MFDLDEYMKNAPVLHNFPEGGEVRKSLICRNGQKISIQASNIHYCTPQNNEGPWTHFELGYLNQLGYDFLIEYAEDTVFSYVPKEKVLQLIELNGGAADENIIDDQPYIESPNEWDLMED